MSERHYSIAKIESTKLGYEDHGILTVWLVVKYGKGSGQGIGGYALDEPKRDADGKHLGRFGSAYGCEFIARTIKACGVDNWEQIVGRTIYVVRDGASEWTDKVIGIAPLPTEPGAEFIFTDIDELAVAS